MAVSLQSRSANGPAFVRLRVLRIDEGQSFRVRSLSEEYGGLLTHWKAGRGIYCPGEGCCDCSRGAGGIWKGYFAAEYFDERNRLWVPTVAELTEAAELDVRFDFNRGCVWQFSRARQTSRKRSPVVLERVGVVDKTKLRPAFDITPVLMTLYHVARIKLDTPSPVPDRIVMEPSADEEGAPLTAQQRAKLSQPSPEEQARMKALIEEGRKRFGSPGTNGHV